MSEVLTKDEILGNFRTPRYHALNQARWDHFLSMGIPIAHKTVFEPGAGVGDQTEWLLVQGARHIYVNEGREGNRAIIRERFEKDLRVSIIHGELETCLPAYEFNVDMIFCWGVYYHLRETLPDVPIMRQFARLGKMIVFDYLAGNDNEASYGYDNPSTSITWYGFRPRRETMTDALKTCWEYVYSPKVPLHWIDPVASEDRVVAVASHFRLDNPNLDRI